MAETQLNQTTNANFIPTIIANKAIGRLPGYLNLARTISKDFEWSATTQGKTIEVPVRGTITAMDKTAGEVYTKQAPTATNVDVTLDNHKHVTLAIDDVTKVLENQNTMNGYVEDAAIALAESVETAIAQLHPNITNTVTFDATSTATKKASILALRKRFVDNKVPRLEPRNLYLDPTVINELLEEDSFTDADKMGSAEAKKNGAIMRLFGFDIYESQMVENSGSPATYHNLAYTKNALVLASRPLPAVPAGYGVESRVVANEDIGIGLRVNSRYDGDYGQMVVTLDLLFGVAVVDQRRVIELESA